MAEYIEREDIKYELWSVGPLCEPLMVVRKKTVDSIPAADVAPVVHGRWEFDKVEMEVYCSVCGHNAPIGMSSYIRTNYCPNCGARMDGDG